MSLFSTLPYLVVVLVALSDVYCGDGSVSFVKPAAPLPPADHTKSWQQINNKNQGQVVPNPWGTINSATTPWPSLGSMRARPQSQNPTNQIPNTNQTRDWVRPNSPSNLGALTSNSRRNVGVDLSYGPNAQNTNYDLKPNQNVGVALSYGISSNANVSTQNPVLGRPQAPAPTQPARSSPSLTETGKDGQVTRASPSTRPTQGGVSSSSPGRGGQPVQVRPIIQPSTGSPSLKSEQGTHPSQTEASLSEDDELREFSEALLKKDTNNVAKYVTINYQGKTTSRSTKDEAPQKLMTIQKDAYEIPSVSKMLLLHNNYILDTTVNEYVTPQERSEENSFLDTILSTSVMQYTRNFLIQKGKISKDPNDFKQKLKEIWFNMYSRGGGRIGSSGFEHVFLAEIKNKTVSGLHNWLYFNDAEVKGEANYLGYMHKIDLGNKGAILKYHFTFSGIDKPVGSMFIGTSPELEIALYTTCFLLRADHVCPLKLNNNKFTIRTFTYRYRGKKMIGSAFPDI